MQPMPGLGKGVPRLRASWHAPSVSLSCVSLPYCLDLGCPASGVGERLTPLLASAPSPMPLGRVLWTPVSGPRPPVWCQPGQRGCPPSLPLPFPLGIRLSGCSLSVPAGCVLSLVWGPGLQRGSLSLLSHPPLPHPASSLPGLWGSARPWDGSGAQSNCPSPAPFTPGTPATAPPFSLLPSPLPPACGAMSGRPFHPSGGEGGTSLGGGGLVGGAGACLQLLVQGVLHGGLWPWY